jgi:serine/threonine protein phosphatase PrpC
MADRDLRIEAASHTDIGGRAEQQDRVAVFGRTDLRLLVLADGMGGHTGGALAAQAVVDVAKARFNAWSGGEAGKLLALIVSAAHERIKGLGAEHGMSPHSTCVLLLVSCGTAAWVHVGDSRLYRFADDLLVDRTIDHSIVELMRLQGRVTEEGMKTHPDQNRLYESLGGARLPHADENDADVAERDGYLLVSDGVWGNTSNEDLEDVYRAVNLGTGVRQLVERAKANGGSSCDNLAAVAARLSR